VAWAPSNNAFKLTSASRVEALRATTRRRRSQLNAMLDLTIPLQESEGGGRLGCGSSAPAGQ
jgi:hypothetical protein